jgi:hypothetical protein
MVFFLTFSQYCEVFIKKLLFFKIQNGGLYRNGVFVILKKSSAINDKYKKKFNRFAKDILKKNNQLICKRKIQYDAENQVAAN